MATWSIRRWQPMMKQTSPSLPAGSTTPLPRADQHEHAGTGAGGVEIAAGDETQPATAAPGLADRLRHGLGLLPA